jgi:predicted ATPase/class 3 adenylate cyclase
MRSDLPSGTVTFLFTDVEGSTRLLHALGAEGYAEALAEHRSLIREACTAEGGVEVDTQGDAFFFAFPTAPGALAAAAVFTEALASGPIQVRVGLHTGTPLLTEEGYVGADVHRAARIAACGHGGQVLVSAATALLVETELTDLGEHRLKDLSAPERVYQLGGEEFAALLSLRQTNLPVPATPFVGRKRELAEAVEMLQRDGVRLVTFTGPGGTGKTRLALQAAAEASDRYPDAVWWIPLATVRDSSLFLATVAQALDVREEPGRPHVETLASALSGRRSLLLLDNIEQLLPDAAGLLAQLTAAPGPVFLVTSRERLQLQGELVYPVSTLEQADGVSLFLERARALDPSFTGDDAVAELCARLDELPLALELAAARTVVFTPEQLLERLTQRLDLLKGSRDADPRQQTLRATVEWSYDLLEEDEQRLFRSLSVFAGGCTFEAAEAVAGADPDTLQSLLDKSLLRRRESEAGRRYWMLGTMQQFAAEALSSDERNWLRGAHLAFFADSLFPLGRAARNREAEALAVLRDEQANAVEALAWAFETGAAEPAQKILRGAWFFWIAFGLAAEGDAWAARVVAIPSEETPLFAHTVAYASEFPRFRGDLERAITMKKRAIALYESLDPDDREITGMLAASHTDIGHVLAQAGDIDAAEAHALRGVEIRRSLGEPFGIAHALAALGDAAQLRGDFDEAARIFRESAELTDAAGDRFEAASHLWGLARALRSGGDHSGATAALEEAQARASASGDPVDLASNRALFGLLALDEGRHADAAELLAQARTELRDLGLAWDLTEEMDAALEQCRAELGDDEYATAFDAGVAAARESSLD